MRENTGIKLGVFGSRSLDDETSKGFIKYQIIEFTVSHKIDYLIAPGDIKGACSVAIDVARETKVPIILFFYKKGTLAGGKWEMIRSIQQRTKHIIEIADFFLVFHDGISKGTMWDLKQVIKAGKPYRYISVPKEKEDVFCFEDFDFETIGNGI